MKKILLFACAVFFLMACRQSPLASLSPSNNDLHFPQLASSWDEGIPLGNGFLGALIWQKDSALRFSLNRVDLWDLRPIDSLSGNNFRFSWVQQQVAKNDYLPVQQKMDAPYDQLPAPTKIPGAAIEFPLNDYGKIQYVHLYLHNAMGEVAWNSGLKLQTFVHANRPVGWFVFNNIPENLDIIPTLIPPIYQDADTVNDYGTVSGQDLRRLGYQQGVVERTDNRLIYHQKGWGDFDYTVAIQWKQKGNQLYGVWSITSSLCSEDAVDEIDKAFKRGIDDDLNTHIAFWKNYWDKSSISIPDTILQKQYQNEMYKFGSVARENGYPISLQAIWTADNGKLPPWKGDYHHDLNTQLSYWPAYIGNHLEEGLSYLNTLWNQRDTYKRYTRQYFETDGMNVPGVASLTGEPLGGWIQYALSPTTGAWLAQHFYLHWKYSADSVFLRQKGYPFLKEVATYMEQITIINEGGFRTLPISSSPEIFNNSIDAWFKTITNYDLALIRFLFQASAEMASALNLPQEAAHWNELLLQLPDFDLDKNGGLSFAKGFPYDESHRHFSHALAFHPLGLLDVSHGNADRLIVNNTVNTLKHYGTDWWTGYSYSWYANMQARVGDGNGAAQSLRTFAQCFCLPNTFHVNGDQSKTGKSKLDYRPFTLEGNFAFAAAVQEMLIQSHTDTIRFFPAIPNDWNNVSFKHLRAVGAFLVSAEMHNKTVSRIEVFSEKGGTCRISLPENFRHFSLSGHYQDYTYHFPILMVKMKENEYVTLIPQKK